MNRSFPQPPVTYISYRRKPDRTFHPPFEQTLSLPSHELTTRILQEYVHSSDEILEQKEVSSVALNQHLLRFERFFHNEMGIPFKVLQEITLFFVCKEELDNLDPSFTIYTYPSQNVHRYDHRSSILDAITDCNINRDNFYRLDHIYVLGRCDDTARTLCPLVERYLQEEEREREDVPFPMIVPETHLRELTIDPSGPSVLDDTLLFSLDSHMTPEHKQRIEEEEKEREEQLNQLREPRYGRLPDEEPIERFMNSLLNSIFSPQRERMFVTRLRTMFDRQFGELTDLMEPVRVTVDNEDLGEFLVKKPYREVTKEELKLTDLPEACSICMENFQANEDTSYLKTCGHLFHDECVRKWLLTYNHRCPMCRLSVDPSKNDPEK